MSHLRARDAGQLLDFVADAEAVGGPEPFTTELLDRLAAVMETGFASYHEYDARGQVSAYVACSNELRHSPPPGDAWDEAHAPRVVHQLGNVGMWSDISNRASRLRFEMTPWAGHYHIIDCVWHVFRLGPSQYANVVFHTQDRDLTERDRQKVIALGPHVWALIRNARARRLLAALTEAVDPDRHDLRGFITLAGASEIEHASPAAQRLLAEWFDEPAGRLPTLVEDWLRSASHGQALRLDRGAKRLVVERPTRDALVFSEEPVLDSKLTAREIEVLHGIAVGKSTAQIARDLWVTPATVSKHLEHIYRKLGVTSRTAALAIIGKTSRIGTDRNYERLGPRG